MPGRVHSREFKLTVCRQISSGAKRPAQVCREHALAESVLARWRKEFADRGEDSFSRYCVGWHLSRDIETHLTLSALEMALPGRSAGAGLIHHSDRGVQYASADYVLRLERAGAQAGGAPPMTTPKPRASSRVSRPRRCI